MLSQSTRGANRFPMPVSLCRFFHLRSYFFGLLPGIVLLALFAGSPLQVRAQDQTQSPNQTQSPDQTQPPAPSSSSSQTTQETVESRRSYQSRRQQTRQRREVQLLTETYTHRWEAYTGGQYMRFRPGPDVHNSGMGGWILGATRYFSPRFGITADARGSYGTNSLGAVNCGGYTAACNAKFSVFTFTIGPQYRFYANTKWSISGALQIGDIYGYFDSHTAGIPPQYVGFYPASNVGAAIGSVNLDYNLSPGLALRIAPMVLLDHFDGNFDHNQGFLVGVVYRFGRQ